jgi:Xaa-Pro aminopeptidase
MNAFETLTLAPIDRRLINAHRISKRELKWINDYHARVRREVMPLLDDEATRSWLEAATEPLVQPQ